MRLKNADFTLLLDTKESKTFWYRYTQDLVSRVAHRGLDGKEYKPRYLVAFSERKSHESDVSISVLRNIPRTGIRLSRATRQTAHAAAVHIEIFRERMR